MDRRVILCPNEIGKHYHLISTTVFIFFFFFLFSLLLIFLFYTILISLNRRMLREKWENRETSRDDRIDSRIFNHFEPFISRVARYVRSLHA